MVGLLLESFYSNSYLENGRYLECIPSLAYFNYFISRPWIGHLQRSLERKVKECTRPDLRLLDELGYLPIDKRGADLMFQVVAVRYEVGSIVILTNRAFMQWGQIFDVDNTLATTMIDRLMHFGEAIFI